MWDSLEEKELREMGNPLPKNMKSHYTNIYMGLLTLERSVGWAAGILEMRNLIWVTQPLLSLGFKKQKPFENLNYEC